MRTVIRSRRPPAALAHAALLVALVALVALLGGACASRTPTVGGKGEGVSNGLQHYSGGVGLA